MKGDFRKGFNRVIWRRMPVILSVLLVFQLFSLGLVPGAEAEDVQEPELVEVQSLSLSSGELPKGIVGEEYSFAFNASGGEMPYSFSMTGGSLPEGLSLSSGGVLSGTPVQEGVYSFTVTVTDYTDPTPQTAVKEYDLEVTAPVLQDKLPGDGPEGPEDSGQQDQGEPEDSDLDHQEDPGSGDPENPDLNDPENPGLQVKEDSQNQLMTPAMGNSSGDLGFTDKEPFFGLVGADYRFTFEAEGGVPPYIFSVLEGNLPDGLTLDEDGVLEGTPSVEGIFEYTILVTDSTAGVPLQATKEFSQEILGGGDRSASADIEKRPAYVEGEVLVKYKAKTTKSAMSQVKSKLGLNVKETLPLINAELCKISSKGGVEETVAALNKDPAVEYAQPNYIYYADAVDPDDSLWEKLWGMHNEGQNIAGTYGVNDMDIDAPEGWEYTDDLDEIVVAVIDTGVDINHPDLKNMIWVNPDEDLDGYDDDGNGLIDDINGWDFYNNDNSVFDVEDGDYHGTHVAGTIAAEANSLGVLGVAPNVKIMPLKFLGYGGKGTTAGAIQAINYAADKGVRISNNSWGGDADSTTDPLLNDAIEASGMLFVAAAGNEGRDVDVEPSSPPCLGAENIISVAAVNNTGGLSSFSNYGATTVDVGAPGQAILSTYPYAPTRCAAVLNGDGDAVVFGFGIESLLATDRSDILGTTLGEVLGVSTVGSSILVVNDGQTDISGFPDYGAVYTNALTGAGYSYNYMAVPFGLRGPTLDTMDDYACVVWFTGEAFGYPQYGITNLTYDDQTALASYLAAGGKLLLAGPEAMFNIESSDFVKYTLDVASSRDLPTYYTSVNGVSGSLFEGDDFQFTSLSHSYADEITPGEGSAPLIEYTEMGYSTYMYLNGTSMAAPHVTGIGAAVLGQKNLTTGELKDLLMESGQDLSSLSGKTVTGKLVNLNNCLATQVGTVSVTLGNTNTSEVSSYTVSFNTGEYGKLLAGSDSITVEFPTGTVLPPSIPADTITVNGNAVGGAGESIVPVGQNVTFKVPVEIGHNSAVTVIFAAGANIGNPSAGSYTLSVNTSTDPVPVVSNSYTLSGAATISSTPALTEENLDAAVLLLSLAGDTFKPGTLSQSSFILSNAPSGTSIDSVDRTDDSHCNITLAYDGTDFDSSIADFHVEISGTVLTSGAALETNNLTITATNDAESISISDDGSIIEGQEDGEIITVTITGGDFANTINPANWTVSNLPAGVSKGEVTRVNAGTVEITLSGNSTVDYDSNINNISVSCTSAEYVDSTGDGSLNASTGVTFTSVVDSVTITPNQALTERNLNDSFLTVELTNCAFTDNILDPANFTLNNAPAGTGIESVIYIDPTHCTINLSFDGTDFDTDINDFSLTIAGSELGRNPQTSNSLLIDAVVESGGGGGGGGGGGPVPPKKTEEPAPAEPEPENGPQPPTLTILLTPNSKTVLVNGQETMLDVPPFIRTETGRTMVPLRFVSEQLGAYVEWLKGSRQVKITLNGTTILLTVGSHIVSVNGQPVEIDSPVEIGNGRTFVPLRFVSETLGTTVTWDETTGNVSITK